MDNPSIAWGCYGLFWATRAWALFGYRREPFRRGRGWFFDLRVAEDFADGARGAAILREYRLRTLVPFTLDIPIAFALLASGQQILAVLLMIAGNAIMKANHATSRQMARMLARAHADPAPPGTFALSLTPRRLRDYMHSRLELAAAAFNVIGLSCLAIATARTSIPAATLWTVPGFLVYLQGGALMAKWAVIEWPHESPRKTRAFRLDIVRAAAAFGVLFWPAKVLVPKAYEPTVVSIFLLAAVAAAVAHAVRRELGHRPSDDVPLVLRGPRIEAKSPVCFAPDAPLPVVPTSRGFSLNLANVQAQAIAAYVVGLVMLALLLGACSATAGPDHARLAPCSGDSGPADAYCGSLDVFENRDARAGRKIALKIVVLPAFTQHASEPLFVLAGGPGESAIDPAIEQRGMFRRFEKARDIVLIDQRGTGRSNGLFCDEEPDAGSESPAGELERTRRCLAAVQTHADVAQYTTRYAIEDLEDVRRFLGYGAIDLYGVSYGTRPAIAYAARYPAATHAVVLDSVAPASMTQPLYVPRDSQRALDRLVADCGASPACSARYPKLGERIARMLSALETAPRHTSYREPTTGERVTRDVDRGTIAQSLLIALYSATSSALVPLLVEQAEGDDFSGWLALRAASRSVTRKLARGAYLSVLCSEDATGIAPDAIARETVRTFLGSGPVEQRLASCRSWPKAAGASTADFIPTSIPTLILSGELDPVTPPEWGAMVARRSANAKQVVVPATAHATLGSSCVADLVARFLVDPDPARLDEKCLAGLRRPAFFVSASGSMLARGS